MTLVLTQEVHADLAAITMWQNLPKFKHDLVLDALYFPVLAALLRDAHT